MVKDADDLGRGDRPMSVASSIYIYMYIYMYIYIYHLLVVTAHQITMHHDQ
jgi:hypothetical protein